MRKQLSPNQRLISDPLWERVGQETFANEAMVETKLIEPLLAALGYTSEDIHPKFPVKFHEGRKGRPNEADFAVFNGASHTRDTSLFVVEAKSPSEALDSGRDQAESYGMWLRAPLYVLTNGHEISVWQLQPTLESTELARFEVSNLLDNRATLEQLLSKQAILDYCNQLSLKTIAVYSSDLSAYEAAELSRAARMRPAISRTVVSLDNRNERLSTQDLLGRFPEGMVVSAPSGLGKTTLTSQLFFEALSLRQRRCRPQLPIEAPFPDLAEQDLPVLEYLHARLESHCPAVSLSAFKQLLRRDGCTIVCDGHDRVASARRRKLEVELRNIRRDFPQVQVIVLTRPGFGVALELPKMAIEPMDVYQQVEFARLHALETGADSTMVYHRLTPLLRRFAEHPLLLRLILDAHADKQSLPGDLEALFSAWLDRLLCSTEISPGSLADRENGLRLLAHATWESAIERPKALKLLRDAGIADSVLDELVACNALAAKGTRWELTHEALADYLRATEVAKRICGEPESSIDKTVFRKGSLLPVILASLLRSREHQDALWRAACQNSLEDYLSALHYRADSSIDLLTSEREEATRLFLSDALEGIELLLELHFPQLRDLLTSELAHFPCNRIGAMGLLGEDLGSLDYCLFPRSSEDDARVLVEKPPRDMSHYRNLALAGFRPDGARLVGADDVRGALRRLIENRAVRGGVLWRHERAMGHLRLIDRQTAIPLIGLPIAEIVTALKPLVGLAFDYGLGTSRYDPISVEDVLNELEFLHNSGIAQLDSWWQSRDLERLDRTDTLRLLRCVPEHFRRVQLAYREVVEESFWSLRSHLRHYPLLPLKYELTLVAQSYGSRCDQALYYDWNPVEDWSDAGASVRIAECPPSLGWHDRRDEIRDALARMGRGATLPFGTLHSRPPDFGGYNLHCTFEGTTSVVAKVTEMLKDDLEELFDGLRT